MEFLKTIRFVDELQNLIMVIRYLDGLFFPQWFDGLVSETWK